MSMISEVLKFFPTTFHYLPSKIKEMIIGESIIKRKSLLDGDCHFISKLYTTIPPLETLKPVLARKLFEIYANAFSIPKAEVKLIQNLKIPMGDSHLSARFYNPTPLKSSLPCLVYFHGGGATVGSVETHDHFCRWIAKESLWTVLSVDYRLSPEHPYPVPLNDSFHAYSWIQENAKSFGLDSQKIGVGGDSAGGNLASAVILKANQAKQKIPYLSILLYPMCDSSIEHPSMEEFADSFLLTTSSIRWFLNNYDPEFLRKKDPFISPVLAQDLSFFPKTFLSTCGFDPLQDEGIAFFKKLENTKIDITYRHYEQLVHGYVNYAGVVPQATTAISEVVQYLKLYYNHAK
jgi:acetyl esterase